MEINKELKDEIWNYCRANNITNIDDFISRCLKQGFTATKFGSTPFEQKEKIVEVEKIIEKEVFITDNKEMKKLTKEIERLDKLKTINEMDRENMLNEMKELETKVKTLTVELEKEKNKKRKDLYGE